MAFKWQGFSKKQLQLMTWWMPESPYRNHNGVIAEGAVRSGKTIIMSLSFLVWSMTQFNLTSFAICGKTVGSLRRNVVTPLKERLWARGYKVIDRKAENYLVVSKGKVSNIYYLFGGRDERSQDLIQGITLGGVLLDEVALMPRSFVEQAMARCSVEGSKFWFNCNPEGPNHWFYVEHVKESVKHKYIRIHFNIEDNPSLSEAMIARYKAMFTGIFYRALSWASGHLLTELSMIALMRKEIHTPRTREKRYFPFKYWRGITATELCLGTDVTMAYTILLFFLRHIDSKRKAKHFRTIT